VLQAGRRAWRRSAPGTARPPPLRRARPTARTPAAPAEGDAAALAVTPAWQALPLCAEDAPAEAMLGALHCTTAAPCRAVAAAPCTRSGRRRSALSSRELLTSCELLFVLRGRPVGGSLARPRALEHAGAVGGRRGGAGHPRRWTAASRRCIFFTPLLHAAAAEMIGSVAGGAGSAPHSSALAASSANTARDIARERVTHATVAWLIMCEAGTRRRRIHAACARGTRCVDAAAHACPATLRGGAGLARAGARVLASTMRCRAASISPPLSSMPPRRAGRSAPGSSCASWHQATRWRTRGERRARKLLLRLPSAARRAYQSQGQISTTRAWGQARGRTRRDTRARDGLRVCLWPGANVPI
jgi:hypothetical protein